MDRVIQNCFVVVRGGGQWRRRHERVFVVTGRKNHLLFFLCFYGLELCFGFWLVEVDSKRSFVYLLDFFGLTNILQTINPKIYIPIKL